MKKLAITILLASSVSFAASASINNDANVKYVGDMKYASFCKAVVNNDVDLFKMTLGRFVGELGSSRERVLDRILAEGVKCSGADLVEFSTQRKATNIDAYISKKSA